MVQILNKTKSNKVDLDGFLDALLLELTHPIPEAHLKKLLKKHDSELFMLYRIFQSPQVGTRSA